MVVNYNITLLWHEVNFMLSGWILAMASRIWAIRSGTSNKLPLSYLVCSGPSSTVEVMETPAAWAPWSSETICLKSCCFPPVPRPPRLGLHPLCNTQHNHCRHRKQCVITVRSWSGWQIFKLSRDNVKLKTQRAKEWLFCQQTLLYNNFEI